jgi:hypothetical protein
VSRKNFVFYLGFVVRNIYQEPNRHVDLHIRVVGLNKDGKEVWSEPDDYDSLDSWRHEGFGGKFGATEIERRLEVGDTSKKNSLVVMWAVECLEPKVLESWDGSIRIEVTDHERRLKSVRRSVPIAPKPPHLASTLQSDRCVSV